MRRTLAVAALVLLVAAPARAWWGAGHERATELAVRAVADRLPEFFAKGAPIIVKTAPEPDMLRDRKTPQLRDAEYLEHYIDLEYLGGAALPPLRSEFVTLCARRKVWPGKVGTLPYRVAEYTQRLTIHFAEVRRAPDDAAAQARCLVFAGLLAHYAEDLCQPLHTTVDYDGRTGADGKSPRSGIHAKVDALIEKVPEDAAVPAEAVRALSPLMDGVLAELARSHALVDRVYALEEGLPKADAPLVPGSPAAAFADERLRAAAAFAASLYLTAWEDSAKITLPGFYGQ